MLCKRQEQTSVSRNLWRQLCQEDLSALEVKADGRLEGVRDRAPSAQGRAGGEKLLAGVRPAGRIGTMSALIPPLDAASEGDTEAQGDTGLLAASSGLEERLLQRPKSMQKS